MAGNYLGRALCASFLRELLGDRAKHYVRCAGRHYGLGNLLQVWGFDGASPKLLGLGRAFPLPPLWLHHVSDAGKRQVESARQWIVGCTAYVLGGNPDWD